MSLLRNILRETVMMRLLLAFSIGIIAYEIINDKITIWVTISLLLLLFSIYIFSIFQINKYNITFTFYNGLIVFSICILSSFLIAYYQDNRNHLGYVKLLQQNKLEVEIKSNGRITKYNCLYEVSISSKNYQKINTILAIKDDTLRYQIGDKLLVNSSLQPIDYISHPAQFDYKNYLARKHIYHRIKANTDDITLISKSKSFSILKFSNNCRSKLLSILRLNIKDNGSYEMAAALLLGERSELDKDLLKSYSDTGTIHIISVSGLHVGIIFIVLQFILNHLPLFKNKIVKCILIIICIWFYSILTGLPASVIRSALMISFHTIGKTIAIKTNGINHVAASALVLLSINTNYLFDIGFQLSYLAVFGIMYLQKPISDLYVPQNKLSSYIWLTSSVSISAQLFTLPVCLYYFHQFPNYFILANLIAIPLSSIALYASLSNLVFASIPILNKLSEWVLVYSIKWLNAYLGWISKWPYAVSKFERIDIFQATMLCLILFFVLLYRKEKIRIALGLCLLTSIIYTSYLIIDKMNHAHNHLWIQYNSFQTNYSLENKNEIVHFIAKGEKLKITRQQIELWKAYNNKHQRIKFMDKREFELFIKGVKYNNKPTSEHHFGDKYHRLCLK